MPNTHSTLTSLFTDIADAIREKDGSSAPIVADEFPAAVRAIPSGGGEDYATPIIERTISGSYTNLSASKIGVYAFYSCTSLAAASFPACTSISNSAFAGCTSLAAASFPACTTIGSSAFSNCTNLTATSFPACTTIGSYAFTGCTSLAAASFPACTWIGSSAFAGCASLAAASFPACTMIGNYAFFRCYKLLSIYLLNSSVATLGGSAAFTSTPIAGYTTSTGGVYGSIFVRASLLSNWQTKTNWTYFSSRFVGLTDDQIAALT